MAVNDKRFRWDYAAAGKLLLKSGEMAEFVEEQAQRMTRATGMEYKPEVKMGKKRVRAMARGTMDGETVKRSKRHKKEKMERDPESGWPICPKHGEAHAWCKHLKGRG